MLEQAFQDVYTKFKLHFYQNIFQRFATREATLTTVESFCMEGIMGDRELFQKKPASTAKAAKKEARSK